MDYDGEVNRALATLSDPRRVSLYPRKPVQVYTVFYTYIQGCANIQNFGQSKNRIVKYLQQVQVLEFFNI